MIHVPAVREKSTRTVVVERNEFYDISSIPAVIYQYRCLQCG